MIFQNTPEPFNWVVLGMIRRVVRQLNLYIPGVAEFHQSFHPLCSLPVAFWSVISIYDQFIESWKSLVEIRPKLVKSVDHKVRCHRPDRKPEMAFAKLWNKNAEWDKFLIKFKIMIRCFLLDTVFPSSGKRPDFNNSLAIN